MIIYFFTKSKLEITYTQNQVHSAIRPYKKNLIICINTLCFLIEEIYFSFIKNRIISGIVTVTMINLFLYIILDNVNLLNGLFIDQIKNISSYNDIFIYEYHNYI